MRRPFNLSPLKPLSWVRGSAFKKAIRMVVDYFFRNDYRGEGKSFLQKLFIPLVDRVLYRAYRQSDPTLYQKRRGGSTLYDCSPLPPHSLSRDAIQSKSRPLTLTSGGILLNPGVNGQDLDCRRSEIISKSYLGGNNIVVVKQYKGGR